MGEDYCFYWSTLPYGSGLLLVYKYPALWERITGCIEVPCPMGEEYCLYRSTLPYGRGILLVWRSAPTKCERVTVCVEKCSCPMGEGYTVCVEECPCPMGEGYRLCRGVYLPHGRGLPFLWRSAPALWERVTVCMEECSHLVEGFWLYGGFPHNPYLVFPLEREVLHLRGVGWDVFLHAIHFDGLHLRDY